VTLHLRAIEEYRDASYSVGSAGKEGDRTRLTDVFGSAFSTTDSPQVFLVETQPDHAIEPHFHAVPQFQIAVRGSGRLGRHEIDGVVLHYSDAWSSYGPIVAGPSGLSFFTIRMAPDTGAHYMPGARAERPDVDGRQITRAVPPALPADGAVQERARIEQAPDGLEVLELVAPPDARLPISAASATGRLLLVVDGAIVVDGRSYGAGSWGHQQAGSPPDVRADTAGAQLLLLTFPALTDETVDTSVGAE
jgi:hypothetical protein